MNHIPPAAIVFKYKLHASEGSKAEHGKGSFDGRVLRLGNLEIDCASLVAFQQIGNAFYIAYATDDGEFPSANMEVYNTDVKQLESAINSSLSKVRAKAERTSLATVGKLKNYRDAECPFCNSTIILTDLPETDQTYCEYCDSLFSVDRSVVGELERHFRICEGCGMYSRPRKFAVFYFYFLVFTFGFHHDSTERCSGCMQRSSWKMVLGNIFGLLGLPFALLQLYRAYSTRKFIGPFEGLDAANLLARRGKVESALEKYETIMDKMPDHAGIKFNIASGLMVKKDFEHAQTMFELALDDCSNYWPAVQGLMTSLSKQGKVREVEAVTKMWGVPEVFSS